MILRWILVRMLRAWLASEGIDLSRLAVGAELGVGGRLGVASVQGRGLGLYLRAVVER